MQGNNCKCKLRLLKTMTCIIFSYILQVPGYPDYYNIVYDGDIAVYIYKLLEAYKAGEGSAVAQW